MKTRQFFQVVIALLFFFNIASGAAISEVWGGGSSNAYSSGTGTKNDPYVIDSAEELAFLASMVNFYNSYEGEYFILSSDIDLNGVEWTPIGAIDEDVSRDIKGLRDSGVFKGYFDGRGKSILNLKASQARKTSGLFGVIDGGAVRNVVLRGVDISNGLDCGGIAARTYGTEISGCAVTGVVIGERYVGGIAGYYQGSAILTDCEVSVGIFANNKDDPSQIGYSGGLIGYVNGEAFFKNCDVYADLRIYRRDGRFNYRKGALVGGFSALGIKAVGCNVRTN